MLQRASKRQKAALAAGTPLPPKREKNQKPATRPCTRKKCHNTAGRGHEFCRPCRVRMKLAKPKHSKRQRQTRPNAPSTRRNRVVLPLYCYSERNQILKKLGFGSYADYLKSLMWTDIRNDFLLHNPTCCKCGVSATQVHHSQYTYDNLRGRSTQFLHAVCRPCHESAETTNGRKLTIEQANERLGITKPKPDFRKNYNHWKGPPRTAVKRRPITNEAGIKPGRSRETESASDPQLG